MPDPLTGPRAKLDRAKIHQRELSGLLDDFFDIDDPPYEAHWSVDQKTRMAELTVKVLRDPPLAFSTVFGDFLHNVRSSLDCLVADLTRRNGGKVTNRTAFPLCDTPEMFDRAGNKIADLTEDEQEIVRRFQPFGLIAGAYPVNPAAKLRDLSNTDKHSTVHLIFSYSKGDFADMRFEGPGLAEVIGVQGLRPGFVVGDQTMLVKLAFAPEGDLPGHFETTGALPLGFAFGPEDGDPVPQQFVPTVVEFVEGAIETFARVVE